MKTLLVTLSLAVAGAASANAQVFRPSVGSGAVVGAVAGGLIGGHNGDRWAEGAIIGAAAGAIIGGALAPEQPTVYERPPVTYSYNHQVYAPGTQVVANAPTVPDAPTVYTQPAQQVQVVQAPPQVVYQPAPQVVYTQPAPQVVYVPAPPPVVYARPSVSFGIGIYSGPRYPAYRPGYYGHGHYHDYGHRGHGHGRR